MAIKGTDGFCFLYFSFSTNWRYDFDEPRNSIEYPSNFLGDIIREDDGLVSVPLPHTWKDPFDDQRNNNSEIRALFFIYDKKQKKKE